MLVSPSTLLISVYGGNFAVDRRLLDTTGAPTAVAEDVSKLYCEYVLGPGTPYLLPEMMPDRFIIPRLAVALDAEALVRCSCE